jgi:hypothetical protein
MHDRREGPAYHSKKRTLIEPTRLDDGGGYPCCRPGGMMRCLIRQQRVGECRGGKHRNISMRRWRVQVGKSIKRTLHKKKTRDEISSWGGPVDQMDELDVHFHSNRLSTSREPTEGRMETHKMIQINRRRWQLRSLRRLGSAQPLGAINSRKEQWGTRRTPGAGHKCSCKTGGYRRSMSPKAPEC